VVAGPPKGEGWIVLCPNRVDNINYVSGLRDLHRERVVTLGLPRFVPEDFDGDLQHIQCSQFTISVRSQYLADS